MDVTIIGTGNMARGIGSRVLAGGHNLTVVGKDSASAEEVAAELRRLAGGGTVETAVASDPVGGEVVVLAGLVGRPTARAGRVTEPGYALFAGAVRRRRARLVRGRSRRRVSSRFCVASSRSTPARP